MKLHASIVNEGLWDKLKALVKGGSNPMELEPLTKEDRTYIKKFFPTGSNADITFTNEPNSTYVLLNNVNARHGRGIVSFRKVDGQLWAGVAYYKSESDVDKKGVSPMIHFDVEIKSDADIEKIKEILK